MSDTLSLVTGPEITLAINGQDVTFRPVSHRKITACFTASLMWSGVLLGEMEVTAEGVRPRVARLISESTGVSASLILGWSDDDFFDAAEAACAVNQEQFTDPKELSRYEATMKQMLVAKGLIPATTLQAGENSMASS